MNRHKRNYRFNKDTRQDPKMENNNKINPEELPEDAVVVDDVNATPEENEEAQETVAEGVDTLA